MNQKAKRFKTNMCAVVRQGLKEGQDIISGLYVNNYMAGAEYALVKSVGPSNNAYNAIPVRYNSTLEIFEALETGAINYAYNDLLFERKVAFKSKDGKLCIADRPDPRDVPLYRVGDIVKVHPDIASQQSGAVGNEVSWYREMYENQWAQIVALTTSGSNGTATLTYECKPVKLDGGGRFVHAGESWRTYSYTESQFDPAHLVAVIDTNGVYTGMDKFVEPNRPFSKPEGLTGNKRVKIYDIEIMEQRHKPSPTDDAIKWVQDSNTPGAYGKFHILEYRSMKYPFKPGQAPCFSSSLFLNDNGRGWELNYQNTLKSSTQQELFTHLLLERKDYYESLLQADTANLGYSLYESFRKIELYYKSTNPQPQPIPQGGQPMPGAQSVVDESLVKELRDAIKALNKPQPKSALEEKLIAAVIDKSKDIATAELQEEIRVRLDAYIQQTYGILPQVVEVKVAGRDPKEITGLFHEKFDDILTMVVNDIPVMLTGPAGVGKNFTLEQIAKALDIEFYYTGAITQEYKLTGFIDAGGRYHETEFYKSFKNGGIFMLDEVDASSPEILVLLNGAIANRYFDFPTGRIKAHEDFRITCAGNTFGTGADMIYVGRNVLDGATLDRFAVIQMGYDEEVESKLCPDKEYLTFVRTIRDAINKMKLRHIVGMRASINGYKAIKAGMDAAFVIESIVMKGMSLDDLTVVAKNIPAKGGQWFDGLKVYTKKVEGLR